MRFEIYIWIVAATLILGFLMPQQGPRRKNYIILMAVMHAFICGFRYYHMHGDLMKYHTTFNGLAGYGWLSSQVLHEGRNAGFYLLMKLVNHVTGGNFQILLILIAVICEYIVGKLVYRYSPRPWMSYLVWNALGFYIFSFFAIKQALSMAFVMLSVIGILERRPKYFLAMVFLAGMIHAPAFVFLPAYWITNQKINTKALLMYVLAGIVIFIFKNQLVDLISGFYYEEEEELVYSGRLGFRFLMIVLIVACGVLLKGFRERNVEALCHMMIISALLQIFGGFDNVFTRLTDYYFQFSVIFIPMLFFHTGGKQRLDRTGAVFLFDSGSLRVFCGVVTVVLLYFYWVYTLGSGQLTYTVDDLLNYRFMWDVQ